jgi:hypothetical protein
VTLRDSSTTHWLVHISAKYLYPEHLGKSFDLDLFPLDETYQTVSSEAHAETKTRSLTARNFVLLDGREEPIRRVLDYSEDGGH